MTSDPDRTPPVEAAAIKPFPYYNRLWINILALALADAIALSCAIGLGEWIRAWVRGEVMTMGWSWGIIPLWWMGAAAMRMLPDWGIGPVEHLRRIVNLLAIIFGGVAAVLFLSKIGTMASRLTYTAIFLLSVFLVPLVRIWMKDELLRIQLWGVPVVVYGSDESVAHIVEALRNEAGLGYYPIGNFGDQSGVGGVVAGIPVLGGISDTTNQAVVAIVTKIKGSVQKEIRLIEGPLSRYRRVIVIPDLLEAPSLWVTPRDFLGVLGLELTNNLLNPWARALKRVTDIAFIVLSAPLWVPLVGVIALLIWMQDRAAPFFLQERSGFRGKVFKTIKLRTMLPNAEAELRRVMEQEPGLAEEWEHNFKLKQDPRITRLGMFLRKTSLDELPQLINVLKGDMSLVGPRPLPRYHEDKLPERVRKQREFVRPGITGLWQVSGRSDAGTAGMDRWDSYYVRNWSIWLDVVILVRTVRAVARGRGAY
jgi:Undecaprenyl-phosphate galactose phosphotransferase WbaP